MKYDQAHFSMDPDNAFTWKAACEMYQHLWDMDAYITCTNEYLDAFPGDRKR